ncbi:MAG: GatB/Yqey domain protein [Candidatus Roizmanbacteria bacterium GW2011_GWA2_37_7]|uniref:GatB/Yqey domain protein n=1 Tax=Candidatus Roizmanbacteria bacterium GW2011_GWA2_37_7 TaxID=1618481 RepID=A0A0G0JLM5_9BACT|nr:MAG: GatB/Yqey domain protein [Candidatus Roizmanbacteria bacterium GW2011_GWA2_37_7]
MIKQTLQKEQIEAMKAKETFRLQTIRYILAQIKNKEIDSQKELSDEEVVDVLRKEAKKLQDSIDAYKNANRDDLQTESQQQLDILSTYLPQQLSDKELKVKVQDIVDQKKELFEKNPNAMIGICIGKLKSMADSGRIAQIVRSLQEK